MVAKQTETPAPPAGGSSEARATVPARVVSPPGRCSLRLYVAGTTPRSTQAIASVRALCEKYLTAEYDLEVVDIYQQPEEAAAAEIIAAPTLVRVLPAPERRAVGDFSDRDRVIAALDLPIHPL